LTQRGWIAQKQVDVLYTISNKRLMALPSVPAVVEFGRNEHDRAVLALLTSISDIGVTIVLPPKVPRPRVAALRQALAELIKDSEFVRAERGIGIDIDPLSVADVEGIVGHVTGASQDIVAALKTAIEPAN
jgi:tripartite-type tricarboxylate transporter receptor subunit TctC